MKKILIFSHAMEIGGAEKALLGLLETIDTKRYQVDLFLMRHSGELMKYIPEKINLLPMIPQYACLAIPITQVIKEGHFLTAFNRWRGKISAQKRIQELRLEHSDVSLEYSHKFTISSMPMINDVEYDLAISFLTPHYFVAEKVKAKKKIAWIHTDYSKVQVDKESQLKMWQPYDHIASISDQASEVFKTVFPELKEKLFVLENIMPMKYMHCLENTFSVCDEFTEDGSVKLLSIGRFTGAKNFDNIPDICRRILKKGIDIKWYIIGYGGEESLIRAKIQEANMQNNVLILGKKDNPYPYIMACDIYIQPSRYEGKCVTVREAQILHKPVIITNYATSSSQLRDGYDGIIVPMDNEGCAEGIVRVINNLELQKRLIDNTKEIDYSNREEINKLYQLVN